MCCVGVEIAYRIGDSTTIGLFGCGSIGADETKILSMAIVIASAHLSDEDFLAAFAACELPLSSFRHGDHLRLAWLHLHRKPFHQALEAVKDGIRRYAAHHGVSHIFHETVTTAWVTLLATHNEPSFSQFIMENEDRLHRGLLHRFWTPAAIESEAARLSWLPPDKEALPM